MEARNRRMLARNAELLRVIYMVLGRKKLKARKPSASAKGTSTVTVARRFECSPQEVFDAWLDPTQASKFLFATPGGEMTRCEIDASPAGRFLIVERRDGEEVEHLGEYTEILRPSRLAFAFVVPKYSPVSTRVSIEIEPGKTGCELRLTNLGIPEAIAAKCESGWSGILDGLAHLLGSRAQV
jgi:uncharacterized protein YndB with AHSA1/START domain